MKEARYISLATEMKKKISRGEWAPGDRISSERELSDAFGVSRPTIGKALGQLVSEGLLERQQGSGTFVRCPQATANHLIQFMYYKDRDDIAGITSHLTLLRAIESRASREGFRVLFGSTPPEGHEPPALIESGLIAVGPVSDDILEQYQAAGIPAVLVDHEAPHIDSVAIDNEGAAYACTASLVGMGHSRICFVNDTRHDGREWPNSAIRYAGHRRALQDAGIAVLPGLSIPTSEGLDLVPEVNKATPSAILFASPHACRHFLDDLAHTSEKRDQLTVASFGSKDDFPASLPPGVDLSVLEVDWNEIGEVACGLLLERIREGHGMPRKTLLSPVLSKIGP